MKRRLAAILALLMALTMMISMTACGSKQEEEDAEEIAAIDEAVTEEVENGPEVVYTIEAVDEVEDMNVPILVSSITLFDDGTVLVVPTDDLKKNEMKEDPDAPGIYPFADSGEVKDVSVVNWGNGGYRTIIAVLKDGTISCVNGAALVEDHIIAVLNNVAGRDDFESVENTADESAWGIIGITKDGEEVVLDYRLNFNN